MIKTKADLLKALEKVPDDYELRIVALGGPHVSVANAVVHDEEKRVALFLEYRREIDGHGISYDVKIELSE